MKQVRHYDLTGLGRKTACGREIVRSMDMRYGTHVTNDPERITCEACAALAPKPRRRRR